jgi:hypothetical protein
MGDALTNGTVVSASEKYAWTESEPSIWSRAKHRAGLEVEQPKMACPILKLRATSRGRVAALDHQSPANDNFAQ